MTNQKTPTEVLIDHLVDDHKVSPWQLMHLVVSTGRLHNTLHSDPVLGPVWSHSHEGDGGQ